MTRAPRAIVLAAGFGTRLGALSDERPKPLLPVADHALIRYAIALLAGHGITEVAINLHHRGELIERELGDGSALGVRIHYSREESILGTGGGLVRIGDWLTDGGRAPFLVVNGKILIDVDLHELLARHHAHDAAATMVVRETPDAAKWGAIEVDESGRVRRIIGVGQPAPHVCMFTGVHVLSPRLLARLPATGESDSIRQAYLPALEAGDRIEAILYDGYFHEHSTPERYLEGNWNALEGRAHLRHPPGPLAGVDPTAHLLPSVHVEGSHRIGPHANLGSNVTLAGRVVVGAHARIANNVRLERVVVWPDSECNESLTDAIVTPKGIFRL